MFAQPSVEEIIVVLGSEVRVRDGFACLNHSNAILACNLANPFVDSVCIRMYFRAAKCKTLEADAVSANPRRSVQVGETL